MTPSARPRRLTPALIAAVSITLLAASARAQSIGELNSDISSLEGQVSSSLNNEAAGKSVVEKLDNAETMFAKVASNPKTNKSELISAFDRLESMLARVHETYQKKKDDCIAQIDEGGAQCDYSAPEEVALAAAYPLAWLRFQGATTVYAENPERAKRLLSQSIDDFTQSTLVMPDPNLVRENVLGRAYCERELGKYDKSQYDKAIQDFKQIMSEGSGTKQYKAAQQGLATTYAAMGNAAEAQKLSGNLGTGGGAQMFKLQNTYAAMYASKDAAKKQEYLKEIVDVIRSKENDKEGWAIGVAAVAKYSHNPVEELGSGDAFQKHLLANVLFAKKNENEAARYFLDAARSGKYPRDYKYAAGIYEKQGNTQMVQQIVNELARSPGNPDAQWAAYERYRIPRSDWEKTGRKNTQLENTWLTAADDYLKHYPKGEFANECRFRVGEHQQAQKDYVGAAKTYADVSGGEYGFTARFNAAECNYLALVAASSKDNKAPAANAAELRTNAINLLRDTIKMAPDAERSTGNPAQKKFVHETRGRAIYMLAGLLQSDMQKNPKNAEEVASLLNGYEGQYPGMNQKFQDIFEWRTQALNQTGRYDEIERDLASFIERNQGNTQNSDFIKTLGIDFWKDYQQKVVMKDPANQKAAKADAKLTTVAYDYFQKLVDSKKMQPKNLTGTLSILGQAYMVLGDQAKGEQIFQEVVKADPASPDANAGLARIQEAKKNYKDAMNLWTNVENTAAESEDLWYEAKFHVAKIYAAQGNVQGACGKLAQTRAEHPGLGTPEMKAQWDAYQKQLCLDHKS